MAMITCPECGKEISSTAKSCPNCGYVRKLKKPKGMKLLDSLCILSLVISVFMCLAGAGMFAYALDLIWLIIYALKYRKYKDNPEYDSKGIKVSMITIFIIFMGTCVFTL